MPSLLTKMCRTSTLCWNTIWTLTTKGTSLTELPIGRKLVHILTVIHSSKKNGSISLLRIDPPYTFSHCWKFDSLRICAFWSDQLWELYVLLYSFSIKWRVIDLYFVSYLRENYSEVGNWQKFNVNTRSEIVSAKLWVCYTDTTKSCEIIFILIYILNKRNHYVLNFLLAVVNYFKKNIS